MVIPETATGVLLLVVVPFPSCPAELFPQHWTAPLASSAQVWLLPADTLCAVVIPDAATGVLLSVVVLLPSCPKPLDPQHCTPPLARSAQVWLLPADTWAYDCA